MSRQTPTGQAIERGDQVRHLFEVAPYGRALPCGVLDEYLSPLPSSRRGFASDFGRGRDAGIGRGGLRAPGWTTRVLRAQLYARSISWRNASRDRARMTGPAREVNQVEPSGSRAAQARLLARRGNSFISSRGRGLSSHPLGLRENI